MHIERIICRYLNESFFEIYEEYLFSKRGQGRISNVASLPYLFSTNKKRRRLLAGYCLRQMGNDTAVRSEET